MIWEEITSEVKRLQTDEKSLKKFGLTMAVVFGLFSLLALYKASGAFAVVFLLCIGFGGIGIIRPLLLKKIYIGWMTLAVTMGYFMTRVILSIMFYGVFLIFGLIARIFNRDMLDQQYDAEATTYWTQREKPKDIKQHLEQQF